MSLVSRGDNQELYTKRMALGADDKKRLLQWVHDGDCILDVGTGRLTMPTLINTEYPNCSVYALEASKSMYKEAMEYMRKNPVSSCALFNTDYFRYMANDGEGKYDCIIFCSILHEIFSYTEYNGQYFNPDIIKEALHTAVKGLKPGGRILIRDAIRPEAETSVLVTAKDEETTRLIERFNWEFRGNNYLCKRVGHNKFKLPYSSTVDLLYTITWGPESFPFEVKEQLGYYTCADWDNLIEELHDFYAVEKLHFERYLQQGYIDHLESKVSLTTLDDRALGFPYSNMILVLRKPK